MATQSIKDKTLLNALQKAVEFENTKGKQNTCFYCGEKYGAVQNFDLAKTEESSPACVKPDTAQKLMERGWGHFPLRLHQ